MNWRKHESDEDALRRINGWATKAELRNSGKRIDSDESRFVEIIASLRASGQLHKGLDIDAAITKARAEVKAAAEAKARFKKTVDLIEAGR